MSTDFQNPRASARGAVNCYAGDGERRNQMNCNCKLDIEKKLLENFQDEAPEAGGHYVELCGYGLVATEKAMVLKGFMPYKASAEYPLKKGGVRNKKMEGSMFFNYCPFCGVKA